MAEAAETVVAIGARLDELEKKLDQMDATVKDRVEKTNKESQINPFEGITEKALKALAVFGTIELGIGALNVASDAFSGNIEDAATALEQLPAGIGPVARQLRTLLGTMTGITDEIERSEALTARIVETQKLQLDNAVALAAARREGAAALEQVERQIALLRAEPGDRESLAVELDAAQRIVAIERQIAQAREQADQRATDPARAQRLAELEEERAKAVERIVSAEAEVDRRRQSTGVVGLEINIRSAEKLVAERQSELRTIEDTIAKNREQIEADKERIVQLEALLDRVRELNETESEERGRVATEARTEAFDRQVESLERRARLLREADEFGRQRLQAEFTFEDVTGDLSQFGEGQAQAIRDAARDVLEAELAAIDERERALKEKEDKAEEARLDRIVKQKQKEQELRLRDETRQIDAVRDVTSRIREEQLRAAGDIEGARIESITRQFQRQIDAAIESGNDLLAERLAQLRDLELAGGARETSFQQISLSRIALDGVQRPDENRVQNEQLQEQKEQTKQLKELVRQRAVAVLA